jgi:hypothetical protein
MIAPLGLCSVSVLLKTAVTDAFRKYLDFMLILKLLQSFFLYSTTQNDDRIKTSCTIIALWFLNRLNLVYGLRWRNYFFGKCSLSLMFPRIANICLRLAKSN